MVKIPATKEGLPAIEQAISEGVNINVTLLFAEPRYREVCEAYITGLERRLKNGKPVDHVRSVASVFVSRIDSLVDDLLGKKDAENNKGLMGLVAVANTKLIYQAFKEVFGSARFKALAEKGAHVQRPLWGSTGTKNPSYSDLLYVDTLIGLDTVNTVPPQTYVAILDHGKPALTAESDLNGAKKVLNDVGAAGVDMQWVLKKLEDDGVASFEKSFDGLYKKLVEKRGQFVTDSVPTT
jgi:transaldolase